MKWFYLTLTAFLLSTCTLSAQQGVWKIGVNSFFDNTEFGHSEYQIPQTMAGVHLSPEFGLSWDSINQLNVGADLMHEFGSDKMFDFSNLIAYYEYHFEPFTFVMGAIPRQLILNNYPRLFFSDSIYNYRPYINGFCWEYAKGTSFVKVWLDWTSRQTLTRHETFFMGESAQVTLNDFFIRHFGYMFHYAGVKDPVIPEALHDNGLYLTSLGLNLADKTGFDQLETSLGWVIGIEDARDGHSSWLKHNALLFETKAEYRGIGFENSYYKGDGQMAFYQDHGMDLYWGDRVYRVNEYDRADFFVRFINKNGVDVKLLYTLHFLKQQLYHEQSLYVTFNLNSVEKVLEKPSTTIWSKWVKSLRQNN